MRLKGDIRTTKTNTTAVGEHVSDTHEKEIVYYYEKLKLRSWA
jgi:hypothetical protein